MDEFLKFLNGKNIHIIGVSGCEGSNILRFLLKNNVPNLKAHDLLLAGSVEKSFKLWHKGIEVRERERAFQQFKSDLSRVEFYTGKSYLKGIDSAEIIFVPQSWRLYKENLPLFSIKEKNKAIFYSLTKLYLELSQAKIVGVTGTVGKGSTANMLFEILKAGLPANRRVYFAGNETWRMQLLDKVDLMNKDDILILEISHRQLLDGFRRAPFILIFTNLFPNHLDEISFAEYKNLKLSLLFAQTKNDISILNYDIKELREVGSKLSSRIYFFSANKREMNMKDVQKIYTYFLSNKSIHYLDNILASGTAALLLGIFDTQIINFVQFIKPLNARLNFITERSGVKFFNDIKSTTPWATFAAVNKLGKNTILICGGRKKRIDYKEFFLTIKNKIKKIILLESELVSEIKNYLSEKEFSLVTTLEEAIKVGYQSSVTGDNILVSPAAGFFYSDFIKGKNSLNKIVTFLPPKEQVE